MLSTVQPIIDFLFPPSEDALLLRAAREDMLTGLLNDRVIDGMQVLLPFSDPHARAAIHEAKFHRNKKATRMLTHVLRMYLDKHKKPCFLVPVPLSPARYRERGYNQVSEVAKLALQDVPSVTLREDILRRVRHTKPQTQLSKEARVRNVADAFGVRDPHAVTENHILLLDDVLTTGATMRAAKAALLPHHPASITCIALAH